MTDEPPEDSSDEEGTAREEPRRSSRQPKKPNWLFLVSIVFLPFIIFIIIVGLSIFGTFESRKL